MIAFGKDDSLRDWDDWDDPLREWDGNKTRRLEVEKIRR